ncbi:ClC family H(+)/Cl(-) exchange transporter, partial [Klebsiella pneumoniae]
VLYNRLILSFLHWFDALHRIPKLVKISAIGAVIGVALTLDADLVGGGDDLTQALLTGQQLTFVGVAVIVVVRFVAGPLSYAAGTPGGMFALMLALGALLGLVGGHVVDMISPGVGTDLMLALMMVGMATMFTSVVRAPLTGAILVMEM